MAQALLFEYGITAELGVGMRLLEHLNGKTGQCNPSYRTVATAVRYERETVMRATKRMEKDNFIKIKKNTRPGSGNMSNSYEFNWARLTSEEEKQATADPDVTVGTGATLTSPTADLRGDDYGDLGVSIPGDVAGDAEIASKRNSGNDEEENRERENTEMKQPACDSWVVDIDWDELNDEESNDEVERGDDDSGDGFDIGESPSIPNTGVERMVIDVVAAGDAHMRAVAAKLDADDLEVPPHLARRCENETQVWGTRTAHACARDAAGCAQLR
jgi:hypothetical protein